MDNNCGDNAFIYRLNDNGNGPSLLTKVCSERGWRCFQNYCGSEDRWNLWWRSTSFSNITNWNLGDWQFMNHIPKGGLICRKDNLSRLLRCMRKVYGSIYDFSPPSYHLPLEYAKFVSECSRMRRDAGDGSGCVWIHKPVGQSQGRGIFLFRNVCDMSCGSAAVVQKYIERPLLIAGYKFDLRLYVCVPTYRPLTVYMYAEGLARFGTDKYTLTDIHNPYRHLTNSSLNKSGPRFSECKDMIGNGCKWTLKQVRRALISRCGASEWLMWQRIRTLVTLTLLAQTAGIPPAKNCFTLYGFDVLLDDSLKPWLLEVNLSPALASDCDADVAVKGPMLHELFDLLGMPTKRTGDLSLDDRFILNQIEYCSEDDSHIKPNTKCSTENIARRGNRWRKRRAVPMHCISIQPPMTKSTSSISKNESDDCLRIALNNATNRKKKTAVGNIWGNGVRWDKAPGRCGLWTRIFPHTSPVDGMESEDIRECVSQISKLGKAAKEIVKSSNPKQTLTRESTKDAIFNEMLKKKVDFGSHFEVWLPPHT